MSAPVFIHLFTSDIMLIHKNCPCGTVLFTSLLLFILIDPSEII